MTVPLSSRRAGVLAGAVSLSVLVALGGVSAAVADDSSGSSAVAAIDSAAPGVLEDLASGSAPGQSDSGVVTVPDDPSDGIVLDPAAGDPIRVSLPFAARASDATGTTAGPAVVAYDNDNGSTTVPVLKDDGSVEITTVIARADAPSTYSYKVSIPSGGALKPDNSGAVAIVDAAGNYVAGFAAPWATDANGRSVPTRYTISGTTLTQTVDLKEGNVAYPVVADPWLGIALIDHVKWVTYSKWSPTLAVTPTLFGRAATVAAGWAAWDEVVKLGGSKANTNSMNIQFFCHWDAVRVYAPTKPTWDLDSKRPNTSLVNEINYKCNYPDGGKEW